MKQTENFALPQWEKDDRIMMEDFNAAMAAIDAALPKIAIGTYTGDGTTNRFIEIGFTPKAVYLADGRGWPGFVYDRSYYLHGGLLVEGGSNPAFSLAENGITVGGGSNENNAAFSYLAIG